MHIRPADLADIETILALDHAYETDHVWQMSGTAGIRECQTAFTLVKLPRMIQVSYPHDAQSLRRVLHRCDYLWVMQSATPRDLLGYIGMSVVPWQSTGWVPAFAVRAGERRKGIGTQLLRAAIAQARTAGVHSVTLDVQTKNHPATRLLQSRGFRYSGFADNYYSSHDIALFFAYRIR